MKKIIAALLLASVVAHAGQLGDKRTSGVVKSFDDKFVKIETNGKIFEFDINRVIDRKNLAIGKVTQISLENKK